MENLSNNTNDKIKITTHGEDRFRETLRNLDMYDVWCFHVRGDSYTDENWGERQAQIDSIYDLKEDIEKQYYVKEVDDEEFTELTRKWMVPLFELLDDDDILDILSAFDDCIYNNKEFIIELMEHSGAICQIICCSPNPENIIKEILDDRELLEKIYKKEILTNCNLDGDEILSILLIQLNYCENLTKDKEHMMKILKNIETIIDDDSAPFHIMNDMLAKHCNELLNERDFTEVVFDYIECCTEQKDYDIFKVEKLAKKMLLNPELALDKDLAERYVKDFHWLYNIDKGFFKDKKFMNMVLDKCESFILEDFELPAQFYSDSDILNKYIAAKAEEYTIKGINFDFDNEVLAKIYESYYHESMQEGLRQEIKYQLENNHSIVICGEDSDKYKESINILQQWAEDEDLIKIGDKLEIIHSPKGETIEDKINIVTGAESKNTYTEDKWERKCS